jgi:hypothetical protein
VKKEVQVQSPEASRELQKEHPGLVAPRDSAVQELINARNKCMGKLTNEFVKECLDRQDGDVPQSILAIAEGANPVDALLERISREEILDWLKQEFDGLLMHGFEPLSENGGLETNNAEILLGYLEKTKAETSPGLKFEVEPVGDPEELRAEGKYYQEFAVTIRYEGVELGGCILVKFQQRHANSHRIFHNLLFLSGFRQFYTPKIDYLNWADNWEVPLARKTLARKGLPKLLCRFSYPCWNLTG